MNFDDLAMQRKLVQLFCDRHAASIQAFRSGESYKLKDDEQGLGEGLHHLTSTATCIESLLQCPSSFRPADCAPEDYARFFARAAIERRPEEWKSEESATIYCRCRGLPLAIRFADGKHAATRIEAHIATILKQIDVDPRFAIGEANPSIEERDAWYPPNAFHTYWTLEILKEFETKYPERYQSFASANFLAQKKAGMLLWIRRTLGYQVALHAAKSSVLDTDQLAWALTSLLRFEERFPSDLGDQDQLREALKHLFATQLDVGTWRHYRSLFHYQKAGNAYCYVYETFAAMLSIAVQGASREFFRDALFEYRSNLHRLWQYADSTKFHLSAAPDDSSPVGWCSGHRLNQTRPESWATASVFAFSEAYRGLLGFWTRESAAKELNVVNPRFSKPPKQVLKERGDSWSAPGGATRSVSDQLFAMFVNPVLRNQAVSVGDDPDRGIIDESQARSAILFGPPGTSKTTLAQAIAACIGWQYVEIHASHFVADGMDQIHHKADEIFRRLVQLDHTVVLFDEIDELVRERGGGNEAFGRFLTTTMLPKLTELWKQRKVIYFVNTNHIRSFDRAITRSQRFDALILVSPPSMAAKVARLTALLKDFGKIASFEDLELAIWSSLRDAGRDDGSEAERNGELREEEQLAKFVLLRFDQLNELAFRLNMLAPGGRRELRVDKRLLCEALKQIADRNLNFRDPYIEFASDLKYPRRDYDKYQVWSVVGIDPGDAPPFERFGDVVWLKIERDERPPEEMHRCSLKSGEPGEVRCASMVTESADRPKRLARKRRK